LDSIDREFKHFAKIRIYTAGKEGSHIITDNFKLFFPGVEVDEIVDRTGAGDCYAAGFLAKLFNLIENKGRLNELLQEDNSEKMKEILSSCGEFATYTAIYKITKQMAPNQNEMENFIKTFRIN